MDKVLIFGCSFSSGSYKFGDPEIYSDKSKGWYHFVDYFNDKDVTVIACGGQGYWSWYQLLLMMDATNRLNYDEIWIQETMGSRPALINLKAMTVLVVSSKTCSSNIFNFEILYFLRNFILNCISAFF